MQVFCIDRNFLLFMVNDFVFHGSFFYIQWLTRFSHDPITQEELQKLKEENISETLEQTGEQINTTDSERISLSLASSMESRLDSLLSELKSVPPQNKSKNIKLANNTSVETVQDVGEVPPCEKFDQPLENSLEIMEDNAPIVFAHPIYGFRTGN